MSDSDENLVRDVFKVPSDNAINAQTAKFRNNTMFSKYNIPNQYTGFDRFGSYLTSRREMSAMSVHSFPMNDQSYFTQSIRSSQSMYNGGRPRSPMSVRSMDSNASVSAADIALAFKNGNFSHHDLRLIKSAFNSLIKKQLRTRIEKRRKYKIIRRRHKRKSSGESGDNDSDSSLSADHRSVRSEVIPNIRPIRRSADRNMFTNLIRENGTMYDSTDNFKRNTLRNQLNVLSRTTAKCNTTSYDKHQNIERSYTEVSQNVHNHSNTAQNTMHKNQFNEQVQSTNFLNQTERFAKNSVLLPYQRFGVSKENSKIVGKPKSNQQEKSACNKLCETDSENEDIFTQSTNKVNFIQTNGYQHKRVLETDKMTYPEQKKSKLTAANKKKGISSSPFTDNSNKDFNFKMPQMPIQRPSTHIRETDTEKVIAKSAQPLLGNVDIMPSENQEKTFDKHKQKTQISHNNIDTINNNTQVETTQNTTNVSMKRKLFTQKLDIAENRNNSSDNLGVNSPQTKTLGTGKEKTKVRKLTSQSCLKSDVCGENNFLDLIHKIVPLEQINITNAVNKKRVRNSTKHSKKIQQKDDSWDVTSVISMCRSDDASETFTDDEILNAPRECKVTDKEVKTVTHKSANTNNTQTKQGKVALQCTVVVDKLQEKSNLLENQSELKDKPCPYKKSVKDCVKSFWDTDFETDVEEMIDRSSKTKLQPGLMQSTDTSKDNKFTTGKNTLTNYFSTVTTRSADVPKCTKSAVKENLKDKMSDKHHENNENDMNMSTRSQSKKQESLMQTQEDNLNKAQLTSKAKYQNGKKEVKLNTPPSANKENSTLNISRESMRLKQKMEAKKDVNTPNANNESSLNKTKESQRIKQRKKSKEKLITTSTNKENSTLNISRESQRLKQKRMFNHSQSQESVIKEAKESSTKSRTAPDILSTSRESARLKEKREAKLNCSNTSSISKR